MAFQWVYAKGAAWVTLDQKAQLHIEALWQRDASGWIDSDKIKKPVYVDTSEMVLMYDSYAYTIARRRTK